MAHAHVNLRVQKHRQSLRMAGLRPVQIWVPDTRMPNFALECARQSHLVNLADADDRETQALLEQSLNDIEGWTA